MKANEYIKKNGINAARGLLRSGRGIVSIGGKNSFHTDELQRLVESHELVERFDGLDSCKLGLYYLDKNNISSFEHRFVDDLSCTTVRFKQAIADVEACQ